MKARSSSLNGDFGKYVDAPENIHSPEGMKLLQILRKKVHRRELEYPLIRSPKICELLAQRRFQLVLGRKFLVRGRESTGMSMVRPDVGRNDGTSIGVVGAPHGRSASEVELSRARVDASSILSLFGTMKSRVGYPKKPFETLEEAQTWVNRFVGWYNEEHRHSALNWVTPMARHTGAERELLRRREETYRRAQQRRPQRWSRGIRDCSLTDVGQATAAASLVFFLGLRVTAGAGDA